MKKQIKLKVNGVDYEMWIKPHWTLLENVKAMVDFTKEYGVYR